MYETQSSFFYQDQVIEQTNKLDALKEVLMRYAEEHARPVYMISKAMGTEKEYSYDLSEVVILLIPKHKICIVNYGEPTEELEDFVADFKEDTGVISKIYDYSKILGRSRKWGEELFISYQMQDFDVNAYLNETVPKENERKIDLLISLLIGSINDINRIGIDEPQTTLEKIKRDIRLYDASQTRFLYSSPINKRITIQGLAGTGKTELLLNKLIDLYTKDDTCKIAFTCHNKVLAAELRNHKIPTAFNFRKVTEQIKWFSRLFVFHSWGSRTEPHSGLISFLHEHYGTTFLRYGEAPSFEILCGQINQELNDIENFEPYFDYVMVDESQDFGEEFLKLCEKIAKKNIYIGGDIFQNIFDSPGNSQDTEIDFLLSKCYRTDGRTLMFAHAVGMGLFEQPKINWLSDDGWYKCGYSFSKSSGNLVTLSRGSLHRFEDLELENTIRLISFPQDALAKTVADQIASIYEEYPDTKPEDIAVIVLGKSAALKEYCSSIAEEIHERFQLMSIFGFESKKTENGYVYISNINNVKGLEFPFMLCVVPGRISNNIRSRNSIYTALTRSFLTSYFIVNEENEQFISNYRDALQQINNGAMTVQEPSENEKIRIQTKMNDERNLDKMSLDEIVDLVDDDCDDGARDLIRKTADYYFTNKQLRGHELIDALATFAKSLSKTSNDK